MNLKTFRDMTAHLPGHIEVLVDVANDESEDVIGDLTVQAIYLTSDLSLSSDDGDPLAICLQVTAS